MTNYFERSCDNCRRLKIRCDRIKPSCKNCSKRSVGCTRDNPLQKRGPKPKGPKSKKRSTKDRLMIKKIAQKSLDFGESKGAVFSLSQEEELQYSDGMEEYDSDEEMESEFSDIETESNGSISGLSEMTELDEPTPCPYEKMDFGSDKSITPSTPELTQSLESCRPIENHYSYVEPEEFPLRNLKIDIASSLDRVIKRDLADFETKLNSISTIDLDQKQIDCIIYYFTTIHPFLPLISHPRFLSLLTKTTSHTTQLMIHLVSLICQVSLLFVTKPSIFKNSILTFLLQCNLDAVKTADTTDPLSFLPPLNHALTMLIRYHCAITMTN